MTDVSVAAPATTPGAGAAPRAWPRVDPRWVIVAAGVAFLALGVLNFSSGQRRQIASNSWPLDFDINLVAAQRLVDHERSTTAARSRRDGIDMVGPQMARTSHGPFSSYIGTPPVALTHVPFLAFDHDTGARTVPDSRR